VVSFYFTPAMFALIQRRVKVADERLSGATTIAAQLGVG
jgi:hypothetical protein